MDARSFPSNNFRDVFGRVFQISKYLCVFPFQVKPDGLRLDYSSLGFCLLLTASNVYIGTQTWGKVFHFQVKSGIVMRNFQILRRFSVFLLSPISTFWTAYSVGKINEFVSSIILVKQTLKLSPKESNTTVIFAGTLNLFILINGSVHHGGDWLHWMVFIMNCTFASHGLLLSLQFCSLLQELRSLYQALITNLKVENAEELTSCHELLVSSSHLLVQSYSPQLLILLCSIYCYFVVHIVGIVTKIIEEEYFGASYFLTWVVFDCTIVWILVYNCQDALNVEKDFDKLLYQLIIYDDSDALLRNKRIQIHFKSASNEGFSVMGILNFDYPLICTMVSSATTYIVFLVQFH